MHVDPVWSLRTISNPSTEKFPGVDILQVLTIIESQKSGRSKKLRNLLSSLPELPSESFRHSGQHFCPSSLENVGRPELISLANDIQAHSQPGPVQTTPDFVIAQDRRNFVPSQTPVGLMIHVRRPPAIPR